MLSGEIALVTGATRGIGRAIADELGRQNAVVVGTATQQTGADRISERLASAGIKGRGLVMNVTEPASIENALQTSRRRDLIWVRGSVWEGMRG